MNILADYAVRLAAQLDADKRLALLDQYGKAGSVCPQFGRKKATLTVTKCLLYYKLIYGATTSLQHTRSLSHLVRGHICQSNLAEFPKWDN